MKIAVTGGTGFIGKLLVEKHIKRGDQVRVLSRKKSSKVKGIKFFCGDLSNPELDLSSFVDGVDVLYHCAGEINNKSLMKELHVDATKRLIDVSLGKVGRWIQLSSVGAYGLYRSGVITDSSKEIPSGIYERTKTESDNIIRNSGIPFCIIRPSNVFGKNMPNKSLRELLNAVRKGLFFFIGKENESFVNYIHFDDLVNALILCSEKDKALGQVFIVSQSTTVENMILSFIPKSAIDKKILRLPENIVRFFVRFFRCIPGFPLTSSRVDALTNKCIYNSTKIQKTLGFKYSMTLNESLKLFAKNNIF